MSTATGDKFDTFYCLIAGSRNFDNYDLLCRVMDYLLQNHGSKFHEDIVIVSGGARGADSLAERYAHERHYDLKVINADWNQYGKSAGFIRNREMHKFMIKYTKNRPDKRACVCFWDGSSRGTQHNFQLCKEFNTPLRVWDYVHCCYVNP